MTFAAATLRIILALAASSCAGWAAARFFTGGLKRQERAAWSLATGLLVQSALLLLFFAVRIRPGVASFFLADAAVVGLSVFVRRPGFKEGRRSPRRSRRCSPVIPLLGGVAIAGWGVFLIVALSEPMWSTDYLAIWGLKGKTIYSTASLPGRLFHDPALAWSHPEYPLLLPLSLAALGSFTGAWNDQALALLFPLCELATLAALWGFLARRVSAVAGGVAAALAALCFFLYGGVNAGTAEVPFAMAAVLASCAVLDFLDAGSRSSQARLAVAAILCASLKQEGTVFILLLSGLVIVRSWRFRRRSAALGALLLAGPALLQAGLLSLLRGPARRRDFDLALFEPGRWIELAGRFRLVIDRVLGTEAREALVPLAAILFFLLLTRRGIADRLLPVFAGQLLVYALACSVSAFDPVWAVDGAFARVALTLFPAFALVLAARLAKLETAPTGQQESSLSLAWQL